MKALFKRAYKYFTRPELDIITRITNLILILGIIALIPCTIMSIYLNTAVDGIIAEVILFFVAVFLLWYMSSGKSDQFPVAMALVGLNAIIFPMLFFKTGGRTTGIIIWMFLGAAYAAFLLKGIYRYLSYVVNIIVFVVCIYVQYFNQDRVLHISVFNECIDVIVAYSVVLLIIGLIFQIQTKLYNKQKKEIELKESELFELNKMLQDASSAKTKFITSISHEIRTPINAVLGMDEMIIRDALDPVILNYAKDIDVAGRQLLSLVNDVLDLSKIEAGKLDLECSDYHIFNVLYDCAKIEKVRANDKRITLSFDVDKDIPKTLYGDENRIRQVVLNLINNAIKSTPKGKVSVIVGYEDEPDGSITLKISVTDTGLGIQEDKLEYLFKEYEQTGENKNIEGTGLGLAISKQLVELMGGAIGVESKYGEGSTFYVRIPQTVVDRDPSGEFSTEDENNRIPRKAHRHSFTAEKANLLVVDDVLVNLNVVRLLLRETKINIDLAESGAEALKYLAKKHYDIVLMDHVMPEMDGIETLRRIRQMENSENRDIPVIALTANAISGLDSIYATAGFCDYLTKPVKVNELERSLIKYLPEDKVDIT